jgi:hypothetical protein
LMHLLLIDFLLVLFLILIIDMRLIKDCGFYSGKIHGNVCKDIYLQAKQTFIDECNRKLLETSSKCHILTMDKFWICHCIGGDFLKLIIFQWEIQKILNLQKLSRIVSIGSHPIERCTKVMSK